MAENQNDDSISQNSLFLLSEKSSQKTFSDLYDDGISQMNNFENDDDKTDPINHIIPELAFKKRAMKKNN